MEVSRKRPLEDETTIPAKKRAVVSAVDTPAKVTGVESGEPVEDEYLETFRKDAIYRRMKHYARESERAKDTITEIDRKRASYAAGLAAMEASWALLIQKLRALVGPEVDQTKEEPSKSILELSAETNVDEDLRTALEHKSHATQKLLQSVIALQKSDRPKQEANLNKQYQILQTQHSAMQAQIALLRTQLSDSSQALEESKEKLADAECRFDRNESRARLKVKAEATATPDPGTPLDVKKDEGSPEATAVVVNGHVTAVNAEELDKLKSGLEVKERHIVELEQQVAQLDAEKAAIALKMSSSSEANVMTSVAYKSLLEQATRYHTDSEEAAKRCEDLQSFLDAVRTQRTEHEENLMAENNKKIEELKGHLAKRDGDINRLRDGRDTLQAEVHDKKHSLDAVAEGNKQTKHLISSRHDRLKTLQNEVARLRMRLAGEAGDEDLYQFLCKNKEFDQSFVDALRKANADLQARLEATDATLQQASKPSELQAEIGDAILLKDAKKKLAAYQKIIQSPNSETRNLISQLTERTEELRICRLSLESKENEIASQQAALDQLAASWETLNDKVDAKLADVSGWEAKVGKLSAEKAKADNKFFAAMRSKDSLEAEQKQTARTLEKQSKAMERLAESEKSLQNLVSSQEKEIVLLEKGSRTLRDRVNHLEHEERVRDVQLDGLQKQIKDASKVVSQYQQETRDKTRSERKLEEQLAHAQKEIARLQSKAKVAAAPPPIGDSALRKQFEDSMALLRCSTCKNQLRSHVLIKCMHTFCKECIDARINTRQRKCPACNIGFSTGEVQQMWFQ